MKSLQTFLYTIFRRLLIVVVLLLVFQSSFSQRWKIRRYEVFGGVTGNSLFGDIGGYPSGKNLYGLKDLQLSQIRPGFEIGMRYKQTQKFWIKGYVGYNMFAASDKGSDNAARGMTTTSSAFVLGAHVEYAFITEDKQRGRLVMDRRGLLNSAGGMALYGFTGLRGLFMKPSLSSPFPVSTDETITNYKFALAIPIGVGYKYFFNRKTSVGLEFSANFTTTDLLDGYTSSFSKSNDFYYQLNVCLAYKLYTKRNGAPSFRRW